MYEKLKFPTFFICLVATFLITVHAMALEFQYQYVIPSMYDRQTAVKIWETVEVIKGVFKVDVNFERKYLFVTFDDTYTNENAIRKALDKAGYKVNEMHLMLEPREGVMN